MSLLISLLSLSTLVGFGAQGATILKNDATIDVSGKLAISGDIIDKSLLNNLIQNGIKKYMNENYQSITTDEHQQLESVESTNEHKKLDYSPKSCYDLFKNGERVSEIREIYPWRNYPHISETVYCDQETDGGGWTVIQRRINVTKRENFYRTWAEYRLGFGKIDEEFWLGNDLISELTSNKLQKLRIDLETYEGDKRWANYGFLHVDDKTNRYRLSIGDYSGNAEDSMSYHHGMFFTTKDQDNDKSGKNCANE